MQLGGGVMERTYDIFEVLEDGVAIWKTAVTGQDAALSKMHELAKDSSNEFRLMHVPSNTLIATTKIPQ